jgi:hypothetical protein
MNNEIIVWTIKQLYLNVEETVSTFVWSSWGKTATTYPVSSWRWETGTPEYKQEYRIIGYL